MKAIDRLTIDAPSPHPIGTPQQGMSPNTGPLASAAWLLARNLRPHEPRWYAEVALDINRHATLDEVDQVDATRFHLQIYSEEWGYMFTHLGRTSWIRVTDIAFVHGRDDYELLRTTPSLREIGTLVRSLEHRFAVTLPRDRPLVRTSLVAAERALREWVVTL
jgi:hypothetical protein